jgi:hypothetical protein
MMDMDTLNLIRARRAEIAKQHQSARRVLETLEKEDAELEAAERVIVRLAGTTKVDGSAVPSGKLSQRDAVISALRLSADPWFCDASALREEASKLYGQEIAQTTFQPLLSTLTNKDRVVVREGPKVALAERIKKQEAA